VQNGEGAHADLDQLYAVLGINPCTKCDECREGWHELCSGDKKNIGLGRDGGFAEFVAVPESALVPVCARAVNLDRR
jgi:D-arabinose 1-dehydrogenase-like Zn-dependent alcohol dehydrogenase